MSETVRIENVSVPSEPRISYAVARLNEQSAPASPSACARTG